MTESELHHEWQTAYDIVLKPDEAPAVVELLSPEMFTDTGARNVFMAVEGLLREQQPVEFATVWEVLELRGHLQDDVRDALRTVKHDYPSATPATFYADKVREQHQKRVARQMLERRIQQLSNGQSAEGILDELSTELEAVTPTTTRRFEGVDASDLHTYADAEPDWLVQGILSADQPTLFGARSKCLKTTQLVDLAVGFARGDKWLQAFDIPRARRVLFITGESNYRAISRRLIKACSARDISLEDIAGMLRVEAVDFPKLPRMEDCEAVRRTVEKHSIEVVIVDPLYRGLTADIDTNRMQMVGDAIVTFAQFCQPASLILSHHVTKAAARELGSPPELEDMTGAGIAESCGNWWLIGRNEKYQWDWKHDLCVQFGGRDEQAGARRIVFDESTWTASVENYRDFIGEREQAAETAQEAAKREKHKRKVDRARARILTAMRNVKRPQSKNAIEARRGEVAQAAFREAFADMVNDQTITVHPYRDGQNRLQSEGYLLAEFRDEYERQFALKEDAR